MLNKYYPPDFDPSKLPRNKKPKTNDMKVRMMLPMSVRCKTCGNYMYKGTKFNTRKEDVMGETYLGIQVFRFYWRCTACAAEFTLKTDPKNADYIVEHGAIRNFEPWREKDAAQAEAKQQREDEEKGNAMKALENRTLDSKREMDIMAALDDMRALNARHNKITTEDALAALKREGEQEDADPLEDDDEAALQEYFQQRAQLLQPAAGSSDSDDEQAARPGALGGLLGKPGSAADATQILHSTQPAAAEAEAAQEPSTAAAAAAKPAAAPSKPQPVVRVVVKRKRAEADDAAAQQAAAAAAAKDEEEVPAGLPGLLGDYGSDGSDE